MISIALCTYNGASYLRAQLASIQQQTLKPDEIIIVDDCSTDHTVSVIEDFVGQSDIAVNFVRNSSNLGIIASFSKAIELCQGDYIVLADQDDLWYAEKVATLYDAFDNAPSETEPLLVYSDAAIIDQHGKLTSASYQLAESLQPLNGPCSDVLTYINSIPGCTMMFRRQLRHHLLPIPSDAILHDWWLALGASLIGTIRYINKPLMSYRIHDDNSWGLDLAVPGRLIDLLKQGELVAHLRTIFVRTVRQANAIKHVLQGHHSLPDNWLNNLQQLSSTRTVRMTPFISGKVKRQGVVRWFSYFLGCLFATDK